MYLSEQIHLFISLPQTLVHIPHTAIWIPSTSQAKDFCWAIFSKILCIDHWKWIWWRRTSWTSWLYFCSWKFCSRHLVRQWAIGRAKGKIQPLPLSRRCLRCGYILVGEDNTAFLELAFRTATIQNWYLAGSKLTFINFSWVLKPWSNKKNHRVLDLRNAQLPNPSLQCTWIPCEATFHWYKGLKWWAQK